MPAPIVEDRIITPRRSIHARIYFWNYKGAWGFATEDEFDPQAQSEPKTNYFIKASDFLNDIDIGRIRLGSWVVFCVHLQRVPHGRAAVARHIQVTKAPTKSEEVTR